MTSSLKTRISKNPEEKSILVTRTFNAPLSFVWRAYTESDLLDQWWGPEPWRAETKFMDFSEGGYWLYAMVGPDGTRHWARMNYKVIELQRTIDGEEGFCDEDGRLNRDLPVNKWVNQFTETDGGTRVDHTLTFETLEGLLTIVDMGFEAGISMGLDQLETLLSKQNL